MVLGSVMIAGEKYETPNVMVFYKTTDDGLSWQTSELTSNDGLADALAVHPTNKNILFTGGYEYITGGQQFALFQTTDAGLNWKRANLTGSGNLRTIAFDPKNTNRVYVGSSNGVWTSTDGGTTWQNPTKVFWITSMVPDPGTANRIYAGTNLGVFISTDSGKSWTETNSGLTNKMILCMDIDPVANVLYAGTQGNGIFRLSLSTGVDAEHPVADKPTQCVLNQNYPNPFNASTRIRYDLTRRMEVRLKILDMRGRIVRVLSDQIENPGTQSAVWDGTDASGKPIPSGIYIYRLEAGEEVVVRKMVYQK
jgi:photosystem II stability/assembly factor-like uncharacterized protein